MKQSDMLEAALAKISDDLDGIEGKVAMEHSLEDCPDPLTCEQHGLEAGKALAPEEPAAVKIEVHKMGIPSLDGVKSDEGKKAEEGLAPDEVEALRKLLKS